MMQEDANSQCERCNGEGEEHHYFINHKRKEVGTDWSYCLECFPGSSCRLYFDMMPNWEWSTFEDYHKHVEIDKYKEHDF